MLGSIHSPILLVTITPASIPYAAPGSGALLLKSYTPSCCGGRLRRALAGNPESEFSLGLGTFSFSRVQIGFMGSKISPGPA